MFCAVAWPDPVRSVGNGSTRLPEFLARHYFKNRFPHASQIQFVAGLVVKEDAWKGEKREAENEGDCCWSRHFGGPARKKHRRYVLQLPPPTMRWFGRDTIKNGEFTCRWFVSATQGDAG